MSYTPTNWQTGDTITAAGLNKMENGIEAAANPFVVTVTDLSADKSYAEIVAAFEAGKEVRLVYNSHIYFLSSVDASAVSFSYLDQSQSSVYFTKINSGGQFYAASKPFMPPASAADNGKGVVVKNGAWETGFPKPFIVTLTPTAQDFSGVMDKTVAEINAAYEAGQKIVFRVLTNANSYVDVPMSYAGRDTTLQYPNFGAEVIQSSTNLMIVAYTEDTNDGTKQTYRTIIYSLTPMS